MRSRLASDTTSRTGKPAPMLYRIDPKNASLVARFVGAPSTAMPWTTRALYTFTKKAMRSARGSGCASRSTACGCECETLALCGSVGPPFGCAAGYTLALLCGDECARACSSPAASTKLRNRSDLACGEAERQQQPVSKQQPYRWGLS